MKKTLTAVCVVLTIALAFGIIAQAAPLLPDKDELSGIAELVLLEAAGSGETGDGQDQGGNTPVEPTDPQPPVATETATDTPDAAVLSATDTASTKSNTLKIAFGGIVNNNVIPILVNGVTYVPFRAFCLETVPGAEVTWDTETNAAYCKAPSLEIEVPFGETYIIANGRVIFRYDANIAINGTMYVPVRSLAKAVGAQVEWRPSEKCVNLVLTGKPIEPASKFYNQNDLLWLARIINAESKYEPLLGKIAVGDVILNRVAHPDFPNTVYEVIFDDRYAIQFYPVTSPIIYSIRLRRSIIAAKACLEVFRSQSRYFI